MTASLNDIYQSIGELTGTVRSLADKIGDNERRNAESIKRADESRAVVHKRLDDLVLRVTYIENDVASVTQRTDAMQAITDDVKTLRVQAAGAGTLGRWLVRIGVTVVTAAGWLVGAYTYLTGRPPP